MTPENRARLEKIFRRLSQPSSMAGLGTLAVVAHVSAPHFAAVTDAIAMVAGLLAVWFDDGSNAAPSTTNTEN